VAVDVGFATGGGDVAGRTRAGDPFSAAGARGGGPASPPHLYLASPDEPPRRVPLEPALTAAGLQTGIVADAAAGRHGTVLLAAMDEDGSNGRIVAVSDAGELVDSVPMPWQHWRGDSHPMSIATSDSGRMYLLTINRSTFDTELVAFDLDPLPEWRAEAWPDSSRSGVPEVVRLDANADGGVSAGWGTSAPAPELPADGFALDLRRHVPLARGRYRFSFETRGRGRVRVGGDLVFDMPAGGRGEAERNVGGPYAAIEIEFVDRGAEAALALAIDPVAALAPPAFLPALQLLHDDESLAGGPRE
jgi:hypothetical protein